MRLTHVLTTAALLAALAACQPPAATEQAEAPTTPPAVETTAPPEPAATNACGILAHRNWQASRSGGSSPALTVSGEIDLPTPGYSVSLARDPAESTSIAEPHLVLTLAPPAGTVIQVVTPTPVRYFGTAPSAYTIVHVTCGGEALTDIAVAAQ